MWFFSLWFTLSVRLIGLVRRSPGKIAIALGFMVGASAALYYLPTAPPSDFVPAPAALSSAAAPPGGGFASSPGAVESAALTPAALQVEATSAARDAPARELQLTAEDIALLANEVEQASLSKDLDRLMAAFADDVLIERRHLDGEVVKLYDYDSYRNTLSLLMPKMSEVHYHRSGELFAIAANGRQAVYQFTLAEGFKLPEEAHDYLYRESWGIELRQGQAKITRVFIEDIY